MSYFDENTLTTVEDLQKNLSYPPSTVSFLLLLRNHRNDSGTYYSHFLQAHKAELHKEEEEILEFYKGWAKCLNQSFLNDSESGKPFYKIDEVMTFDLFGATGRGAFKEHFEETFPYFANARVDFKDLEIFATSKTSGYATMVQRLIGKSADGKEFTMIYRITGVLSKENGVWKWVHEHVSFPVNMATKEADFTSSIDPKKAFSF
jgi:ketosteroid isomerase-like protein